MTHDPKNDEYVAAYLDAIPHPDTSYRSRLRASLAAQPESRRFSWRWPALGAVVTVAAAVVIVFASVWPRGATPVSARTLMQRAVQVAMNPITYSGTAETTFTERPQFAPPGAERDLGMHRMISSWAYQDPTHFWMEATSQQPALQAQTQVFVANGSTPVWYSSLHNTAYRMTGPEATFIFGAFQGGGLQPGTTLQQYLSAYNNPKTGTHAQVIRQDSLLDRKTYVLKVWPVVHTSTGNCSTPSQCLTQSHGYGYALYWIDTATSVILRAEQHGVPNQPGSQQGYVYRVTSIRFGSPPTAAQLNYTPPVPVRSLPGHTTGGTSGSGGPGARWTVPPSFVRAGSPEPGFTLQGSGSEQDLAGPSAAYALYGDVSQFVYIEERVRASGLPAALKTGTQVQAGACAAWTGQYADGPRWLALARGRISILLVSTGLSQSQLVTDAGQVCAAPIAPPPSPAQVRHDTYSRLLGEIDITRQMLRRAIKAAPAADKAVLKGFDKRLNTLGCTVSVLGHAGSWCAEPGFPNERDYSFNETLGALQSELPLVRQLLAQAETQTTNASERHTLTQQGTVVNDLGREVTRLSR